MEEEENLIVGIVVVLQTVVVVHLVVVLQVMVHLVEVEPGQKQDLGKSTN